MKNFRSLIWSLLLPSAGIFSGCNTHAKFEEVSAEVPYRAYIGAVYALEVPMHLSGVHAPPGYGKSVDYYVINPTSPSWSGPELVTRDTLPKGSQIEIASVHRCTNCIFDSGDRLEAIVRMPHNRTQFDRPIKIPLKFLNSPYSRKEAMQPNQTPQPTRDKVPRT